MTKSHEQWDGKLCIRKCYYLPHLQTKLLKEPDKEGEPQLQEGQDVVRLKLLVLLCQHARDVYQFRILDGVPGCQFNRNNLSLSFCLKNHLSFGLRFPTLITSSKMGSLDMSQNQNGISSRFQAKTLAKF